MSDPRNISPTPGAQGVRVTVLAVRRVAALAERALRDAGYTEADAVMQDLFAAKLVAEDALAMEQAGDDLAEPLAREALRMAKDALRAAQKQEAAPEEEGAGAPRAAEEEGPGDAPSAPSAILGEASAASAVEGSPAAPAVTPATAPHSPLPQQAPRPARIDLPEVFAAPATASAPRHARAVEPDEAPLAASASAPTPASVGEPGPRPAPAPAAAPRTRSERGFAIPYGPATAEPAERGFFAAGPEEGPDALHAAPAGAAPDCNAPAGAPAPASLRKPKAAKRVCAALAIALVAMAGAVGAAWWGLFDLPEPVQHRIELLPDAHATQGRLNASEADVAPGSYQLVMNQVATMDAGSRTLPVAFENPEANTHASRLELSLDGERVASTGMVAPGYYVENVALSRMLPQGEHDLLATVQVYSGATQINTMTANVTVRVR